MSVVLSIRVSEITKEKLERLKEVNPDITWDIILEPITSKVKLCKPQCASVKPPPVYPLVLPK